MPLSKYRRWTNEEDNLLIKLYNKKTLKELGIIFNRGSSKICRRAIKLNIKKNRIVYSKTISKILKEKFKNGTLSMKLENNPRWKGGRIIEKNTGYIKIYNPKHPNANGNYVYEHRLIMEKYLKRYLLKSEIIHHINGIKNDNRLKNLILCKSNSEHHKKYHLKESLENISKTPTHKKYAISIKNKG